MKTCSKCGELKPLAEFHRRKASADGLQGQCKACQRENGQRPEAKERQREYEQRPKAKAGRRAYRAANPEKSRASAATYRAANPEKSRAHHTAYRAEALQAYGNRCVGCGTTKNLHFHHVKFDGPAHRREIGGGGAVLAWLRANHFPKGILELRCRGCHARRHNSEKQHHKFIAEILAKPDPRRKTNVNGRVPDRYTEHVLAV